MSRGEAVRAGGQQRLKEVNTLWFSHGSLLFCSAAALALGIRCVSWGEPPSTASIMLTGLLPVLDLSFAGSAPFWCGLISSPGCHLALACVLLSPFLLCLMNCVAVVHRVLCIGKQVLHKEPMAVQLCLRNEVPQGLHTGSVHPSVTKRQHPVSGLEIWTRTRAEFPAPFSSHGIYSKLRLLWTCDLQRIIKVGKDL